MRRGHIHIGTSGWHYAHWVGRFYPEGMDSGDFLSHYVRHFGTVEINNTFYHLPARRTLVQWRDAVPARFVFACKASRFITHMKKLTDPARSTARFLDAIEVLGNKLGPVLFQLPPRWGVDVGRLTAFLDALPEGHRFAFEFRDESWFTAEVYQALADRNAAFCPYDLGGRRAPVEVTADFVYVRLHGPDGPYRGRYDGRTLAGWRRRLLSWSDAGRDAYVYFDNDENAYATGDAARLRDMVERERPRSTP